MDTKSYRASIRHILFTVWDPIGVSEFPEAIDEYDAYGEVILERMANESVSDDAIAQYLYEEATGHMGLEYPELEARCYTAAKAIGAIQLGG